MTAPALDGLAAKHRSHASAGVSAQPAPSLVLAKGAQLHALDGPAS
jgi:hypothetical protein